MNRVAQIPLFLAAILLPLVPAGGQSPPRGIAAVLQPFVDREAVAGAVTLVADRQKVLAVEAVGFLDRAAKVPMHTGAVVWIASMSKPITAAALMLLVDEGKVGLDDPVEKFIPEFKGLRVAPEKDKGGEPRKPAHAITVRECLSHTSGLAFKSPEEAPTLDLLPLREAVLSYTRMPLECQPGTRWIYSNAGINTAGRIIEVVSGMTFEDFLQKRLFEPLGMKDTTFWPTDEHLKRLAKSYKPNAAKDGLEPTPITYLKYPLEDRQGRYPMPGGGLFSTADDVGRFGRMVLAGGTFEGRRVLSEKSVRDMTGRQTAPELKAAYGLGWQIFADGTVGHGGAYGTNLTVDAKRGLVTVYLVQHAGFPADGAKAQGAFRKAAEDRFGGASFRHEKDVIYGRKFGTALTLDVFTPAANANGAGVVWVVSGGWFSNHAAINPEAPYAPVKELTRRGYTVFAVVHGSQPKFTIPEILEDMHRAVRYIRSRAGDFKIDPDRLGITGGSAGGHLSLMQGTAGLPGNPKAPDPVDRFSSRVQAVACFYPPTDFLNYGQPGENALGRGVLKGFPAPFAFQEFDAKGGFGGRFVPVTDEAKVLEIGRQISPVTHASADDPPTFIIHGDQDKLVPIQQAELIVQKLKSVGVPAEVLVKPGAAHGWKGLDTDQARIADWFDRYLKAK